MKKITLLVALTMIFAVQAFSQVRTPAPSPASTVKQAVGLTDVTVVYSRPSMKGRTIFGKLVPYGQLWRTGANAVTKITFSTDVTVEGKEVKKGSYAILTKPGAQAWDVNFYAYESGNWSSYTEKEAAVSVNVKSNQMPMSMENFTIGFDEIKGGKASMHMIWDKTIVSLNIDTKVDATVMASIDKALAGPSTGEYYTMGSYLYDSGKEGKDLERALEYVQKATKTDNPRFWQLRKESLILAKLGKMEEAVKVAKASYELAEKAGNKDYMKMNEDSIAKWTKGGKKEKMNKKKKTKESKGK